MEKNIQLEILSSIGRVYEESKDCKLKEFFFAKIDSELTYLSEYFRVSKIQSFFIANVFVLNYKYYHVTLDELIKYFDCNPMKMLEYNSDFETLYLSGILCGKHRNIQVNLLTKDQQFMINDEIIRAVLRNQPIPEIEKTSKLDSSNIFELLEQFADIGIRHYQKEIPDFGFLVAVNGTIEKNLHFPLIKRIKQLELTLEDSFLYLYLIWKVIFGDESIRLSILLEMVYESRTKQLSRMQDFLLGKNRLIQNNLVEIGKANFFNDTELKLSNYSEEILMDCGVELFLDKKKNRNIIKPESIVYKELIFNKSEMQQLFLLKDLLGNVKLEETQKRLKEKKISNGITVLLYGAPGTGKTEIIKQIVKETNRELMKVDISQSKSMFFGESEKIIKKIFTDYKFLLKESEQTPILFFNEADGIFSKRRDIGISNVAQTENAIQNIILEELENFQGVLIATTNLGNNLDKAFERRFLFKSNFNNRIF